MSDPAAAAHYVFDAYGTLFDHAAALRHKEAIGPAWQQLSQAWHKASRMPLDSRTEPASRDVLGPRAKKPRPCHGLARDQHCRRRPPGPLDRVPDDGRLS